MNTLSHEIERRLAVLSPSSLEIHDDSAEHAGHAGAAAGGGHFNVTIVAAHFEGMPRVKRHREVYTLLADLIPQRIHALSIQALTPAEL